MPSVRGAGAAGFDSSARVTFPFRNGRFGTAEALESTVVRST